MRGETSGSKPGAIRLKRAYAEPAPGDGVRVLVDRLWPRGIAKASARLDAWMKELGPSTALRTWFGHRPERWEAFTSQYRVELQTPLRQALLAILQDVADIEPVTLVFGARDANENEAVVLRQMLIDERAHAPRDWDAPARLLAVIAAIAAANPGATAPKTTVRTFAPAILNPGARDAALAELVDGALILAAEDGWRLTPAGGRRIESRFREMTAVDDTSPKIRTS